jgi:hypothetical protein
MLDQVATNYFILSDWPKTKEEGGHWRKHKEFELLLAKELMLINRKAEDKAVVEARAVHHSQSWPDCINKLPKELAKKRPYCTSCKAASRSTDQLFYAGRGSDRKPLGIITDNNLKRKVGGDVGEMEHKIRVSRTTFGCTNCGKPLCRMREGCWKEHLDRCNLLPN